MSVHAASAPLFPFIKGKCLIVHDLLLLLLLQGEG
jgi:hypothetical protein